MLNAGGRISGAKAGDEGSMYLNSKVPFYYDYGGESYEYGKTGTPKYDVHSDLSYHKGTHGWYMNLPLDNTLDDDGMKAVIQGYFTNLYAATELDFAPLMDEIADGGDDDWYFEAANDDTKVQVWVYPTFDEDENVEEIRLNISISAFNPPESALKDAMLTVLGIKLRWSEDQQHYGLNGTATIDWANNESWGDVVEGYVNALYAAAVEGSPLEDIELLSFNEGSMYAEAWLYTEEGYIVLQCWSSDKGTLSSKAFSN